MKTLYLLLILLALSSSPTLAQRVWNASSPGQRFEVKDNLRRDGRSVVVFVSGNSSQCREFRDQLEPLHDDLSINFLQVDRPKKSSIDWKSPLCRQYNLRELPHVVIFEGKEQVASGYEARKLLLRRLDSLQNPSNR